jgi:hypothetical protein
VSRDSIAATHLFQPPRAVLAPLVAWYRVFPAGPLAPRLRAQFELP